MLGERIEERGVSFLSALCFREPRHEEVLCAAAEMPRQPPAEPASHGERMPASLETPFQR